MSDYLKLDHTPVLAIQYPQCGTCGVDLECDPDSMTCPMCGTSWDTGANDGAEGDPYEDRDDLPGPELDEMAAYLEAHRREAAERDVQMAKWRAEREAAKS